MSLIGAVAATMGGPRVAISDLSVSDTTISPTNASAAYQLTSSGVINRVTVSGGTVAAGQWIMPASAAGSVYEVRATETSGTVSSGTVGSWLPLGTTRTWTLAQTSVGVSTCVLTIEIRMASSGAVLDTATVTLEATKEL